jgi:gluconolactonase
MTRQASFRTIAQTAVFLAFLVVESSCEQDTRSVGRIVQVDPELSSIVPVDSTLEKLIDGFGLLEGPVWSHGYLLFSDMRSHLIYKWHPQTGLSLFLKTGFTRSGPNGLALDKEGRLTICEHGNRRLSRLEKRR